MQKNTKNSPTVQKIYQFQEPSNLICREHLTPKSQEYGFSQVCEQFPVIPYHITFTFRPLPAKSSDPILRNYRKSPFLGHFGH